MRDCCDLERYAEAEGVEVHLLFMGISHALLLKGAGKVSIDALLKGLPPSSPILQRAA